MRPLLDIVREVATKWQRDDALAQGAALAFYMLFSLAPLLVLVIAVAGMALGDAAVRERVLATITDAVGQDAAGTVSGMIDRMRAPGAGFTASIVSIATMLVGASGVFGHLQSVLNRIFDVAVPTGGGVRYAVRRRLAAFGMVLGIGVLLGASMVATTLLDAFRATLAGEVPALAPVLPWLDAVLSIAIAAVLFTATFRVLPDGRPPWGATALGGMATAVLFALGKSLIGFYLARRSGTSIFGAAASLVVLLLWIYYSAQILFVGAEVTAVLARRRRG